MSDARAIKATFSTWRPVNGRKVLQLVFEVPIEQQGEVLTMLGAPDDKWCAIALLNMQPLEDSQGAPLAPSTVPRPQANEAGILPKPKKRFEDYPLSAQCAMRCEDEEFVRYLTEWYPNVMKEHGHSTAEFVRSYCRVSSRSLLSAHDGSLKRWRELERGYQDWLTDQRHAESIRR